MSIDDSMHRRIAEQHDEIGTLKAENAKLRELVRELYFCCSSDDRCHPCPYFGADTECPEPHFSERMRELGIEVDG